MLLVAVDPGGGGGALALSLPMLHLPNITLQCGSVGDDFYFAIQLTLKFHPKSFVFSSPPEPMGLKLAWFHLLFFKQRTNRTISKTIVFSFSMGQY